MKVRVWVDENGLARLFDPADMTVRVCTPKEAAAVAAGKRARSRTSTRPIDTVALERLIEESTTTTGSKGGAL